LNQYEKAVILEQWLKENCTYTLEPDIPPEDQDFVIHFLETREGYCVYYATAMAIMARYLGIPSRYVTGYALLEGDKEYNRYIATSATAHAWTELYFYGVGWLTFDSTGWYNSFDIDATVEDSQGGEAFAAENIEGFGIVDNWIKSYAWIWQVPLLIVILVLAPVILRLWHNKRTYDLKNLELKGNVEGLEVYYRDIVSQITFLGWRQGKAETIISFMRRMGIYLKEEKDKLQSIGLAVSAWRYGGIKPGITDLEAAAALHKYFERMLWQQLSIGKYYFYRILRLNN